MRSLNDIYGIGGPYGVCGRTLPSEFYDCHKCYPKLLQSELTAYKEMCEKLAIYLDSSTCLSEHAAKEFVSSVICEYEKFKKERE